MKGKFWQFLGLAGACIAPAAGQAPAPAATTAESRNWAGLARQDVQAAYESYVANHPGMHDPKNRDFPKQLERARDAGLAIAATAASASDYMHALGAFSAVLSDGHAQAGAKQAFSASGAKRLWPGFIAAWRGRVLVHQAGPEAPAPVGSEIVACDGLPAVEFVRKQLRYRGFRQKEAGHWWYRPTQAFYAIDQLWPGPRECTFELPDGSRRQARLEYRPAPDNFAEMTAAATDGERTPIGLSSPRAGLFLIGMPDFSPGEDGVKAYRTLFETLAKRRSELLRARAVVIDLRHNNGGSSSWSREAARALWGADAVDQRIQEYFRDARIWWRASRGNTDYLTELEAKLRRDGNIATADVMRRVGAGMKAALDQGTPYYVEGDEKASRKRPAKLPVSDFRTPVYVITPGRCASACNDAIDAFTRFANVKLIGAPTSGDSTYMEVRVEDLPSGEGILIIPNKMWVGRPRAGGEVYGPHILVDDLDWSTSTFLDRIEADLAHR